MPIRLGVVMDPISAIHYKKDSTLAMLLAATFMRCDWAVSAEPAVLKRLEIDILIPRG